MTPQKQMVKARTGLVMHAPFFGTIALRMTLKEDRECETAYTNGKVVGYNPDYIQTLSLAETEGLLAHEAMHVALLHHTRRQGRDKAQWNIACDHAINGILKDSGFILPEGGMERIDKSAEEIYANMPVPEPGQPQDPGKSGEVRDLPGENGPPTATEIAQAEAEAKIMVVQAATVAKGHGKLPGSIARMIAEILQPIHDWKTELRRFLAQAAKNDYSWTRPNMRYAAMGLYLPGLYSETMPPIVIAVDTSGSVSHSQLQQFVSEMNSIRSEAQSSQVAVVYCDTKVQEARVFEPDEDMEIKPKGGGGTSFVAPFKWVERESGLDPAAMIYLTDGECDHFPDPPMYPVLWTVIGGWRFKPPFGEVIRI